MLKQVDHHSCVTFLSKDNCIAYAEIDPLQYDEVDYLQSKYGIKSFEFNNGCNSFTQQFYVASLNEVFVEPDHCIALKGFSSIIKESVFYDWYKVSEKKYLKRRILPFQKIKSLDEAILLDGTVGLNYFHFYNDVLTKLNIVKRQFKNKEMPIIVSNKLFHSYLFQFYFRFHYVRNNKWYVLGDNEYLKVHTLYIIKAKQFDFVALTEIVQNTMKALKKGRTSSIGPVNKPRRIFINRKEKNGRFISNFKQVEPILAKFDFEILYMEDITIDRQISIMQTAQIVTGIHGAGLTNLIFSNKEKVQVIEVLPKNFLPTHYYWLCNSFSIKYKAFFGGDLLANQGFEIDVERFEEVLSRYV